MLGNDGAEALNIVGDIDDQRLFEIVREAVQDKLLGSLAVSGTHFIGSASKC